MKDRFPIQIQIGGVRLAYVRETGAVLITCYGDNGGQCDYIKHIDLAPLAAMLKTFSEMKPTEEQ